MTRDKALARVAVLEEALHRILECYEDAADGADEEYRRASDVLHSAPPSDALESLRRRVRNETLEETAAAINAMEVDVWCEFDTGLNAGFVRAARRIRAMKEPSDDR